MKKTICVALTLLIILAFTITASAEEFNEYGNNSGQDTGEIAVSAFQYSRYTISIPDTIDSTDFDGEEISVSNASLESGMSLYVQVTNMDDEFLIPVTHTAKDGVTAKLSIGGNYSNYQRRDIICKFDGEDLEANNEALTTQIHCNLVGQPVAGAYNGTITYRVVCSSALPQAITD